MVKARWIGVRWLGVGTAAVLSVVTIALTLSGQLSLYINPDSTWFTVGMSVFVLIGAVASFTLPLGAEEEHGHDHGDADPEHDHDHDQPAWRVTPGGIAAVSGGVVASGIVISMLVFPAATLSTELAMSRDVGAPQLFGGSDAVTLASTGDTSQFGVGDWASVFATATNPDAFEGDTVTLTGFVTPADDTGDFRLSRLVITHCVIDAQQASLAISAEASVPATGQWVEISGTIRESETGTLEIVASDVSAIDEPQDPYEY
nr:TIGR03943 family protein [Microbacterium endophyticum]